MKRQERVNKRKAEAALSGIFDIKTGPLEDRLGKLPAKSKSKKGSWSKSESTTQPVSQTPAVVGSGVSTDFASEADSINQMQRELLGLGMTMLERMFQLGERLSKTKEKLKHGSWEQWVDDHLDFTTRTARRYIRAYKHRHDALATADPVLFLEEIQGKAEPKSDTAKSDTGVRFEDESSDDPESREQQSKSKVERRNLHKHWSRATADAKEAIEQLIDLQSQYAGWLDELSSDQRSAKLGDRLFAISNLDLTSALNLIKEVASAQLPHL